MTSHAALPKEIADQAETNSCGLVSTLRALHHLNAHLSEPEVRKLLESLALHRDELSAFERFDPESYCRNRIFSNGFVDLLLLCWKPGQKTPIHDHSGSVCGVYVMRGEASEIGFSPSGLGPLVPTGTHTVAAGSITVSSHDDTHVVANYAKSGEELVTLHCYSPPLQSMRVFAEKETFFADYTGVTERATTSGCFHVEIE